MAAETPLRDSHDVGIVLQHKIERLEQVDRCFVHLDYQARVVDDHDHETPVLHKMHSSVTTPESAVGAPLLTEERLEGGAHSDSPEVGSPLRRVSDLNL